GSQDNCPRLRMTEKGSLEGPHARRVQVLDHLDDRSRIETAQPSVGVGERAVQELDPAALHGSLTYTDARLRGFDAAAVVEVIEHLDPPRVGAFERALFGHAQPGTVILTT